MTREIRNHGTAFLDALERLRAAEAEIEAADEALYSAQQRMDTAEWNLEHRRRRVVTYFEALGELAAAMADVVPSDEP